MNLGQISVALGESVNTALLPYTAVVLFLVSLLYAILLNTEEGREWADNQTWATVVIGNGIVIAALAVVLSPIYIAVIFGAFAVAGGPIIYRSLHNQNKERKAARKVMLDDEA